MLELHPGIATDVLLQLKEQTLACYVSYWAFFLDFFFFHVCDMQIEKSGLQRRGHNWKLFFLFLNQNIESCGSVGRSLNWL